MEFLFSKALTVITIALGKYRSPAYEPFLEEDSHNEGFMDEFSVEYFTSLLLVKISLHI